MLRSAIAKAVADAPAGVFGRSLVRVLNDLKAIAEKYDQIGSLDMHAAGLERCIGDFVRNARQFIQDAETQSLDPYDP
jgi:hypothetical protein